MTVKVHKYSAQKTEKPLMLRRGGFFFDAILAFRYATCSPKCYACAMGIYYTTTPKNFDELADSLRGQMERIRELNMAREMMPNSERVIITTESFLSTLEQIEQIQQALCAQSEINIALHEVIASIFSILGITVDDYDDENDE